MKKKWQQLSIFLLGHSFMILFIITGLVFLGFNLFTPYVADDYTYMGGKSLLDMLHKEYMQYMNMNGRSVAHFLARVFLSQNKILFDVINTGMFLWLTYCIYLHANGTKHTRVSKNISALTYLFIPCSIWLFVDVIGQTCLWLVGTCNYMWGAVWIITLLLPYSLYFIHGQNTCQHWYQQIPLILLAVVAGWSSENTSGALIMIMLGWIVYALFTKTKLKAWMFESLIGTLIGYALLIFSPGHSVRMNDPQYAMSVVDDRNPLLIIAERFANATKFLFTKQIVLILLLAFFIILHIYQKKAKELIYSEILFGLAAFACEYALILSPGRQTDRVTFGVTILLVIACSIGLAGTAYDRKELHFVRSAGMTVLLLFTFYQGVNGAYDVVTSYKAATDRVNYVETQVAKGAKQVVVPYITPEPATKYSAQYMLCDLSEFPTFWTNRVFAEHYKLDSVKAVKQERFDLIYKNTERRFTKCSDFTEYLRAIRKKGYTAFLSVHDDDSHFLNRTDKKILKKCGISKTPTFRQSFLAVIDDGKALYSNTGTEKLSYNCTIDDKQFSLLSQGKYNTIDADCSIKMNNQELTSPAGGMHVIVYNKKKHCLVDSVTFTLWRDRNFIR